MENMISGLLTRYETGKLSRRDLIMGLTVLAAAGTTTSAAGLNGITLDHVALQVSDIKRSRDFYVNVFGLVENTSPRANNSLRVDFPNGGFITLQDFNPGGQVDHLCIKLENFDKAVVTEQLQGHGITPIDLPATAEGGAGFHVLDPDGVKVQIR
jgi:glyoxylase I family protein